MSALAQRDLVRVGEAPIDEAALSAFVRDDGAGAVVSFLGTTRDSFVDAVAWIMDELKATVPVWKREVYADGSVWKENPEARARLAAATDAAAGPAAAAAAAAGLSSVACCDPRRRLS
nr:hypothetical protein HK105_001776 [Polyrhizophydium stewartii]